MKSLRRGPGAGSGAAVDGDGKEAPARGPGLRFASAADFEVEEPLLVQRLDRAVFLHRGDGGVDRIDKLGALGEDEAEILGSQSLSDDFQPAFGGGDIALARRAVGQDKIDIIGAKGLDGGAEGFEQLDARVLFVAVKDIVDARSSSGSLIIVPSLSINNTLFMSFRFFPHLNSAGVLTKFCFRLVFQP